MESLRRPLRTTFMWIEGWLDAVFGTRWNPFYSLGALGYFYFWIVAVSGIYIYVFFDTGIQQAYGSVEWMTKDQWFHAGVMRSLHRYASDALVAMMALHLLREFAYDHYRGSRAFSWITGVPLIWLVIAAGVTGYWLVWDKLAQFVAQASAEWLDWLPIFGEPIARNFVSPRHLDGRFFTLLIFLHIGVPLAALFMMWFHLQRVARARVNPPRGLAIGTFVMLLALALVKPAVSQGQANLATVPTEVGLDWFYLWAYPLVDAWSAEAVWLLAIVGTVVLILVPWLPPKKRQAAAKVDPANCNGCTRCFNDCPFGAISMGPRTDGAAFEAQAVVNPNACTSCGICVGACPTAMPFRRASELVAGIELPDYTSAVLREKVMAATKPLEGDRRLLIFGCEHGNRAAKFVGKDIAAVEVPCAGMIPPPFIDFVLSRGLADGVVVSACREGECFYRAGVRRTEARIEGRRDPRLRARVPRERILFAPMAPTEWRKLERSIAEFQGGLPPKNVTRVDEPPAETEEIVT